MADAFDVVVIGGGPAGENVAARTAAGGLSTALVEVERLGGECSFWACVPSKALLRPPEALWLARHSPGAREAVKGSLDASQVLARRDEVVHGYDDSSQLEWARGAKLDVVRGHGRLTGPRAVRVTLREGGTRELTARRAVVLATGSRARIPDVPGLREAKPWTNREGTASKAVPRRLVVMGGGVVATELSQAWRALGTGEVTLLERGEHILGRVEPFARELVEKALRERGITVRTRTQVTRVHRPGGQGEVTVTLDTGETLRADELLVATGRVVSTQDLGVETVGLTPGKPVEVDDQLRARGVEGGWLYACGDVNGRNLLTHMGKYQGRLAGDHILGKQVEAWADTRATPQVIFTHPQVAAVGLSEAEARKRGLPVRTVQVGLDSVAGSSLMGEGFDGAVKLVVDERRRILLGATFVGPEVGEMLHSATIAVAGEVPLDKLWHAVPAYPTVSEVWLRLLESYGL
ncbi:NAD(P)/FAD-dependent oxidoreductase [Vitiosangium sp. GDMCC 1.1324]|uniref:dihydrolipoyl dehydrogenase family protein n=1 Tax=Vitiosangium sp. (strain GDMCC 1.1324) TaxID=2138576 RepID=UPI000D33170D|nr:NAD(P)/FAD-dependent oxidoreductase [Vitiosangium sp. GDMCC 1.1324]PTL75271.1 pyridine nucleotide-disulfide oxidoreductase [Vitiosangium sp. GDMCC 1.1324]